MLDRVLAFGKVMATQIAEKTRAVVATVTGPAAGPDPQNPEADAGSEFALKAPWYGPLGLVARPRPPGKLRDGTPVHCEYLGAKTGDGLAPFAYRDLRHNAVYPAPKDGGLALCGYGGGFYAMEDTAGPSGDQKATIHVLYAPYRFSGGAPAKAHAVTLDTTDGNEAVVVVHGDGMAITMFDGKLVLKNRTGSAYVELSDDGIVLSGNVTVAGGMVVGAAVPGAAAAALPVLTSALTPSAFLKVV